MIKKIMMEIVVTNDVASSSPERRLTAARANFYLLTDPHHLTGQAVQSSC